MRIIRFAFLLALMPFAAAQAQNYVGISGGLMSYSAGNTEMDSQGFTVVAGGQFDPLIAVEFSYTSHASVEVSGPANLDAGMRCVGKLNGNKRVKLTAGNNRKALAVHFRIAG